MRSLFAPLPENLSDLDNTEIRAALDERMATVQLVTAKDADTVRDFAGHEKDLIDQFTAGVEQIETLKDELQTRAAQEQNLDSELSSLAERATTAVSELDPDDDDTDSDDDDPEAEAEVSGEADPAEPVAAADPAAEPVVIETPAVTVVEVAADPVVEPAEPVEVLAASARSKPGLRISVPADRQPRITKGKGVALIASGGIHGIREGSPLDMDGLVRALIKKAQSFGSPGKGDKVIVASGRQEFPADRILDRKNFQINYELIQKVVDEVEAIVASGGVCAPPQPLYDIPGFGTTRRPVRDEALTTFNAARGGVSIPTPTTIGDAAEAITIVTEDEDALGGTFATKAIMEQECPAFVDVFIAAIAARRRFGNFNARSWPENIAHEVENTRKAHARAAESFLLDRIKALSATVTSAKSYNAVADWVYALSRSASSVRYTLRMDENQRFRAVAPVWLLDLMVADTIATQFDRWQAKAQIEAYLERNGVSMTWYLDSPTTGTSQGFEAEVDGTAVDEFPDDVQWALYPEGAFIHLDGGELDLGLIRDSELNEVNDFEFFWETFENVGRVAPKNATRWITSAICPTGTFPALQTARTC